MYPKPSQQQHHANVDASYASLPPASSATQLPSRSHMERGPTSSDYTHTGLPSPYPSNFGDNNSESSPADQASAAQYPVKHEVNYAPSTAPASPYAVYPHSARSGSFHDPQLPRTYHPAHGAVTPTMAQPPPHPNQQQQQQGQPPQQQNSPSMPQSQQDGRNHQPQSANSDNGTQIDPSITAPSPTYAYSQQPPYPPNPEMAHGYQHPGAPIYQQPRPDWAGYGGHGPPPMGQHPGAVYAHHPGAGQQRPSQVYSFVPIPGAQQHKRPRRRYEEIERMYKCGFQGCEKAYGTLNHLNAHVTMQSHGPKRTPEEFKEIRKEWKARKKEEENQRKADEERMRQAQQANVVQNGGPDVQGDGTPTSYAGQRPVTLPPIGYQPQQYPPGANVPQQPLPEQYHNQMYQNYPPHPQSPYGQPPGPGQGPGPNMYNPNNPNNPNQQNGQGPPGH